MMYIRHFEQKQTTIKRKKKKENTPPVYSVFSYIQVYKIERHPFTYTPIILTMEIFAGKTFDLSSPLTQGVYFTR